MPSLLIVTQCCKSKESVELFPDMNVSILSMLSDWAKERLLRARELFRDRIYGVQNVTALSLYVGYEYEVLDKRLIHDLYLRNTMDFIIISAGYGVVHAFEKIREYEAYMDSKTTRTWIRYELPLIIANYIANTHPKEVYGFFSKTSGYQEIFREVINYLPKDLETEIYAVYLENCRGIVNIMRSLGQAINYFIKERRIPRKIGRCTITLDRIEKISGKVLVAVTDDYLISVVDSKLRESIVIAEGSLRRHKVALGDLGLKPFIVCLLYTSPSPRDLSTSRMPSSA